MIDKAMKRISDDALQHFSFFQVLLKHIVLIAGKRYYTDSTHRWINAIINFKKITIAMDSAQPHGL
jgi:hypothetical protein